MVIPTVSSTLIISVVITAKLQNQLAGLHVVLVPHVIHPLLLAILLIHGIQHQLAGKHIILLLLLNAIHPTP
jgi:hypothetical protein